MWFKQLSLAALAAASSQLALASPASSVLQFEGAVKGTTCTISVGGVETPNPATVMLKNVDLETLRNSMSWEFGAFFDIDLKNCAGAATQANAIFQGANGTTVNDGSFGSSLNNMATSHPAEHVQLQIVMRGADGSWRTVKVGSARSEDWIDIGEEKLQLKAMYSLDNSDREKATAGNFEAAAQFTVIYQ